MTALEKIKNKIIDRVMTTKNKKLLEAIDGILESTQPEDIMSLSSEQIEMLMMSEKDIENGYIISESDLNESDTQWS
jgi:hypothetical protein